MRMQFVVLGFAGALAACAPTETAPNPSAPISSMAPGQYRTTVTFAPAPAMTEEQCVSSADITNLVRNSIPGEDIAACSQDTLQTANGRIAGRIVCLDATGSPRTLEVSGAYGNNRADMNLSVTASENGQTVTRQGTAVIERVGECNS